MNGFRGTTRFAVRNRIGAGGMGVVYQAFDRERGGLVALKTLRKLDAKALYRFKTEFRALADLEHPNLVRLGELFGDGDEWFFTMELLEGSDFLTYVRGLEGTPRAVAGAETVTDEISTLIERTIDSDPPPSMPAADDPIAAAATLPPPADERRLRASLRQLAQGISALHAVGKVHRDIKPSNVLVTATGRVVLLDLGLVIDAQRKDALESGTQIVGTATYMAPEQASSQPVGPGADWYALGSVLYEALTGQPPFRGAPLEILLKKQSYEPPPPRTLAPDVPRDLDALCADLLRREPRDRPAAEQILERLGASHGLQLTLPLASIPSTPETPFVGRVRELEALRAAYAEAAAGLPISTFVLGESGMGKSALVRRFLDEIEAEHPGAVVLTGRCYERESVPFKAFDDVVDALAGHLTRIDQVDAALLLPADVAMLARVFPVLRRVPALARAAETRIPDLQELRARAFAALRELLRALARRAPLVLFIDDFQWTDADSLALFTAVMHGLEAPPLFFVATVRASAEEVAAAQLPAALATVQSVPGDLRTLPVCALSAEEARALATTLLSGGHGGGAGAGGSGNHDVGAIAREGAGHPLFIHELVRHLGASPGGGGAVRLDDALWARIRLLDPTSCRVLELIAVAGEPLPQRLVMQAAALDPGEVPRVTGVLRIASLVRTTGARGDDTIECYHDRVREAVTARLDAATQREHHERLANVLEATAGAGQDLQMLVRHLEAAGLLERAAAQAARAARGAAHTLAFERAAAMYATALQFGTHGDAVARQLRLEMADALVNAGRGTDAADAYLAAAEGADPAARLECRRKAAGQLLIAGEIERGLATLEGVLTEFGERLPTTPGRALISLLWNRTRLWLRGLGFTPRAEAAISARDLMLVDIYHSVGVGLALVDTMRGADFQSRGLLLALRTGERKRVVRGLGLYAGILASQGRRANARAMRILARCAEVVGDAPDSDLHGWVSGSTGLAHYVGGRFREGAGRLLEAEVQLRDETVGNTWELNTVRIYRLLALRALGHWAAMRRGLDECLRDAARRGDRYAETTASRSCNLAWLVADDPARARRELDALRWAPPEGGYHIQHWYEHRARTELALYEGDLGGARRVLDDARAQLARSFLLRVETIRNELNWLTGRLALARAVAGGPATLIEEAQASARKLAREPVGYAHAWGALLEAAITARRGDATATRDRFAAAVTLCEAQELRMCAAAGRLALGDLRGEEMMLEEGVKNPSKILAMYLPGG